MAEHIPSTRLVCAIASVLIPVLGILSLAAVGILLVIHFHLQYMCIWIAHLGELPLELIAAALFSYAVWMWNRLLYPRCASARSSSHG